MNYFFKSLFLLLLLSATFMILVMTSTYSINIEVMLFGLILGTLLIKITHYDYLYNGLLVLGTLILVIIAMNSLNDFSVFENNWVLALAGFSGSLVCLLVYNKVLQTYSKRESSLFIIVFLSVLFVLYGSLLEYNENILSVYNAIAWVLIFVGIYYLFSDFKYKSVWLFFLLCRWILSTRYKIIYEGSEQLKELEGLVLISNHTSWVDWLLLQFSLEPRVHYIINKRIYNKRFIHTLISLNGCIPISKGSSKDGFSQAKRLLEEKKIIGIFPEGSITSTGKLGKFFPGFKLLDQPSSAKIIPVCIHGLWGSRFSYSKEKFINKKKGFRRLVRIRFGKPLELGSEESKIKEAIQVMLDEYNKQQ